MEFDEILKQKGKGKGRGRKKLNNQGSEKGKKKKEDKMPDKTKFIAKAKKVKSKDSKEEEKHESLKSVRSELLEPMVNEGVRVEEVEEKRHFKTEKEIEVRGMEKGKSVRMEDIIDDLMNDLV